jgi:N-acetylglucosamine malate deacetylase 1
MKIAVVVAHPDYMVTIIGGTLIKHAQSGDDVHVIVLCPGELGPGTVVYPEKSRPELVDLRIRELDAAASLMGLKEVRVLRFEDTQIKNTPDLRFTIGSLLREIRPDILITHWMHDAHPDLRETGQASVDACLISVLGYLKTEYPPHEVKKVYTFGIRTTIDFKPEIFIDISSVIEEKFQAIQCLDSVVQEMRIFTASKTEPDRWKEKILGPDLYWGQESGTRYAEPFKEFKQPEGKRAVDRLPL